MSQQQIDALLAERAGYVQRKLSARIAAVDAALAALGYRATKPVETATVAPETERAVQPKATKKRGHADE